MRSGFAGMMASVRGAGAHLQELPVVLGVEAHPRCVAGDGRTRCRHVHIHIHVHIHVHVQCGHGSVLPWLAVITRSRHATCPLKNRRRSLSRAAQRNGDGSPAVRGGRDPCRRRSGTKTPRGRPVPPRGGSARQSALRPSSRPRPGSRSGSSAPRCSGGFCDIAFIHRSMGRGRSRARRREPRRSKACFMPPPWPRVSPAGAFPGGRTLARGRSARQGPERAGAAARQRPGGAVPVPGVDRLRGRLARAHPSGRERYVGLPAAGGDAATEGAQRVHHAVRVAVRVGSVAGETSARPSRSPQQSPFSDLSLLLTHPGVRRTGCGRSSGAPGLVPRETQRAPTVDRVEFQTHGRRPRGGGPADRRVPRGGARRKDLTPPGAYSDDGGRRPWASRRPGLDRGAPPVWAPGRPCRGKGVFGHCGSRRGSRAAGDAGGSR